ncbi:GvpL/GvpF family gas vesicle protein [Nocardioides sp. LHG3406-4]|uniref:GvpL/GvpF family gas vesicle protein n=1 Tax=Nocardioides sp. LHG3406-4 TaxID=2804575 RepID=UPI003CF1DA38
MSELARYLYAITRNVEPSRLAGAIGLGGGSLEMVSHRGLAAVVSDVSLDEYGEDALRQNLERLEWLETVARAHDAVIREVAAVGPVAPLRLATICLDDDGVRHRLDEWHFALEQVLDRVEGREEWSVKLFTPQVHREPERADVGAGAGLGGAEYLRRKKAATQAREVVEEEASRIAHEVHAALAVESVASRQLPAQDPRLTGHAGTMLLNSAYLVEADEVPRFASRVQAMVEQHPSIEISCTGPWPPYSFAMLEQR